MSRLFFHFKNLTEDEIALFSAKIREGVIIDLQIDCYGIDAIAFIDEDKASEFTEFLHENNIKDEHLREIDA
jgi:hypothetical protein